MKRWGFRILWLCIAQSCTTGQAVVPAVTSPTVWIDSSFSSQLLNDRVLMCTDLKKSDLTNENLSAYLLKNSKPTNAQGNKIMIGDYHRYPDAWFYTQLINTTGTAYNLVVDEDNHLRCDGIEVITFKGNSLTHWGSLVRTTPFSERQIPFYPYAIPMTINAKDTLHLLIHTQKGYGVHEVNLTIADYPVFLDKTTDQFIIQFIVIIILILCAFIMGFTGWLFKDKTMFYLGVYLLAITMSFITTVGITDSLVSYPDIGIAVNGAGTMFLFLVNAFYHPYGMQLMKAVPKNEKRFKIISLSMMTVNLVVACCFLLPLHLFHTIDMYLPALMGVLSLISLFWLFYSSLLAYFRAGIMYFLGAVLITFLPFLYEQLTNRFIEDVAPLTLKLNQSSFLLAVVGVSVLSIFQLKEKLVARKKYEENLTELKGSMEAIRKTEIEAIGRNLHDNVGNILASALGYMNRKKTITDTPQHLVMEAINEIRFLSHNLVKDEDIPLLQKLESLVSRFNDFSAVLFRFDDFSEGRINRLDKMKQQNIYMIIQEIFTNIIKHAKATEASIQVFEREGNTLQFTIEDDGIGMADFSENKGIGLKNIYKRAEISKLKLTIDSSPAGTNIIIETLTIK